MGCSTYKPYTWPDGTKYIGEWKGMKVHGWGTYIWPNGNKYIGEFKDGKKHGQGTYYFGEFKYEGKWINDKPITDGQGEHAAYGHWLWGEEYDRKQQYKEAIREYKKALSKKHNKWIAFSCYNNMGIIYRNVDNVEEAYHCFHKAAEVWPARAYWPYMGLSTLAYKQGNLEESLKFRQMAYHLVQRNEYEKIEQQYSCYNMDTLKKWVTIFYEAVQIQLDFSELKNQYVRKNYQQVELLAEKILSRKYHASLGISVEGTIISSVNDEGIGALNGIVVGDQLLEIDGKKISNHRTAVTELANLYDRFGEKIKVKIKRKAREITMVCHLFYPELETTKRMLNKARTIFAKGKYQDFSKDVEPPQIIILKPEAKRGLRVVGSNLIDFLFLVGDNVKVSSVSIDGTLCNASEASVLEKTFFDGDVKKYTAQLSVVAGCNTHTIKAIDTSGNVTTKHVSVAYTPRLTEKLESLYQHSVAIVIGINKYSKWPSLEFAVSDAEAVIEKLRGLGFHYIIELYDQEATRLQILRLLRDKLPNMLEENDRLIVYFAGHGQTETFKYKDRQGQIIKEKEGYLIPIDGDRINYRGTAISMAAIREASKNYGAKHILYVFDSCYSGLGLKRSGGIKKADDYIKKLASMKAVQIITAGGEDEQVQEEKGHGIFTRHLLLALEGKADLDNDGFITASEIGTYIRPTVSRKTNNAQTPKFGWILGEGDFIFESISDHEK